MDPTPKSKSYKKQIQNKLVNFIITISGEILSLSADYDNKKYRILYSIEELQNLHNFFKQFSNINQILSVFDKIFTTSNNYFIENNKIFIKFKNFLDEEISISLPEDTQNIDSIYFELKKFQMENILLKKLLNNKENQNYKDISLL